MKHKLFFIATLVLLLPPLVIYSYDPIYDDCCVNQVQLPTSVFAFDGYINVNVSEAKHMIETNSNLVILDVRTQEEYDEGHIENAILIPVSELESRLDELDSEEDTLVYCRSGGRSATASQILVYNGFTSVYNMLGGITAWRNEGYMVYIKYSSIQEAINDADDGDSIYVSSGIYYENVVVNKTVALAGENRNTTIVDGNQTGAVVTVVADNVSMRRFTIQNGKVGLDLNSNGNTITSNIFSSNGVQKTDLKTNLEIYPEPPSVPIWRFLYDLIDSSYTEFLDLTTDTPLLAVEVIGHSDVAELCLGLFYDENMDGIPQPQEYAGFGSRDQVTGVILPNPPKGSYIIKVQGWDVLGNPGHFDREIKMFNGYGIGAHQTANNTISQNLITENYAGVYLQSCSNTTTHMNNMTKNLGGIIVGDLVKSAIYANNIFSNNFTICLRASRDINVTNNTLSFNIFGTHLWNSSYINVTENDLYWHGGWSIGLISSVDNNVANNNISRVNGLDGIRLMFSSSNNLTGNDISYCEHSGILLWYDCYNNNATNNNISFSGSLGWGHGHGVEVLLSSNNVFSKNVISFNERNQGIVAIETSLNNFTENIISSNHIGIQLRSSFENRVYHNSIIDNLEQQALDDTGENFWDDGYPSGGNYWSEYGGADNFSGSFQNITGNDGIGDEPYIIDVDIIDRYPLMESWISELLETDLNNDGTINVLDISIVALAFGTKPGDDNWNEIADLNNDEIVNILDLSTVALDFGKNVWSTTLFYTYNVVNVYPHDTDAFTQGLVYENDTLYESTGLYSNSTLRQVELETGEIKQLISLPDQFFGEGITIFDDKIIQLTWRSNTGFVYDKHSFELLQEFYYPTEGWGITHNGSLLIMSDGTATLFFLNPETFEIVRQVEVHYDDEPVTRLNELEYIQGDIYANIWKDERIAIINPQTGQVKGWIDLRGIADSEDGDVDNVLNGIAYDAEEDRLFITGKRWAHLYEIELITT